MASSLGDLIVRIGADVTDFQTAVSSVTGLLETSASTWASAGAVLSASVTAPLVGLGLAAWSAGETFEDAGKRIEARTGTIGTALEGLNKSFEDVFTTVPTSATAAADAITQLNQALGLTGPPLTQIATQVVSLNRMLGETAPSAQAVAQMFNQWNVAASDQTQILDQLFVAYQKTGTSIASMTGELATFGPQLQGVGFDLTHSIALLAQLEQAGVNVQPVIRGLNTALANFAKEGVADPAAALADLIQKIKDAGSTTEATGLIVKDFGARAATQFATAVRNGRFDVDDLVKSLQNSQGAITTTEQKTRTLGDAWVLFKSQLDLALKPLGTELVQGLDSAQKSGAGLVPIISDLVKWFTSLSGTTQTVILGVAGLAAAIGPLLIATAGVVASIGVLGPLLVAMATTATTVAFAISTGLVPALTGAELVLARLLQAVPMVAAAFAGWKLGEWLQSFTTDYQNAESEVNKLAAALQAQGVEVVRGGASLQDWAKQVFAASDNTKTLQDEVSKYTAILQAHGVVVGKNIGSLQSYHDVLKDLAAQYGPVKDGATAAAEAQETEAQKLKEYTAWVNAENAAIAEEIAYRSKQFDAFRKLRQATEDALSADNDFAGGILRVKDAHEQLGYKLELITPQLEAIGQQISTADGLTNEYTDSLHALDPALSDTADLADRMRASGIQNSTALKQSADAAYDLWQQMLNTTDAEGKQVFTVGELGQAYLDFLEKLKASSLAAGTWTADNEAALQRTRDAVNGTFTDTKTAAGTWATDITRSISGAASSMSSNLADVITGTKGLAQAFEDMGKRILTSILDVVIKQGLKALWKELTDAMADGGVISGLLKAFKDLFSKIGGWLSDLAYSIVNIFQTASSSAADLASNLSTYNPNLGAAPPENVPGAPSGGTGGDVTGLSDVQKTKLGIDPGSMGGWATFGYEFGKDIAQGTVQSWLSTILTTITGPTGLVWGQGQILAASTRIAAATESSVVWLNSIFGGIGSGYFAAIQGIFQHIADSVEMASTRLLDLNNKVDLSGIFDKLVTGFGSVVTAVNTVNSSIVNYAVPALMSELDAIYLALVRPTGSATPNAGGGSSPSPSMSGLPAAPAQTGETATIAITDTGGINAIGALSSVVSDGFKSLIAAGLWGSSGSTSSLSDALRSISAAVGISYQPGSVSTGSAEAGAAGTGTDVLSVLASSVTDGLKAVLDGLKSIADGEAGLPAVIGSSAAAILDGLKSLSIAFGSLTSIVRDASDNSLQAIVGFSDSVARGFETLLNIFDAGYKVLIPDVHAMSLALAGGGAVPVVNVSVYLDSTEITSTVMTEVTNTLQQQGGKL